MWDTPYEWSKRLAEVGRYRNASVVIRALSGLPLSRMTSILIQIPVIHLLNSNSLALLFTAALRRRIAEHSSCV